MENKILGIMSLAIIVEGCITYINQFFVGGHFSWEILLSIILGIVVSVSYNLDIPSYFDFKSSVPLVGNFITGILLSRGSNYIYDLLNTIKN